MMDWKKMDERMRELQKKLDNLLNEATEGGVIATGQFMHGKRSLECFLEEVCIDMHATHEFFLQEFGPEK